MIEAPDFLSLTQLLKATPAEEGGQRFIYLEASNEAMDQQGEVVLAKALKESADYYLQFGNLDLDHYTQLGPKLGIRDYHLYEIGRPVDVQIDGKHTFVKAMLFSGAGEVARCANQVWESLTAISPPQRWYPSVGGAVLEKAHALDPKSGDKRAVVKRVRWTNIGLSKTPVNQTVPTAATVPFGAFAKSFCPGSGCWDIAKAMEAGYGTDLAALSGGGALRKQSLDGKVQSTLPTNYFDFREQISSAVHSGKAQPTAVGLTRYAVGQFGLSEDEASEWVERFLRDLSDNLKAKRGTR